MLTMDGKGSMSNYTKEELKALKNLVWCKKDGDYLYASRLCRHLMRELIKVDVVTDRVECTTECGDCAKTYAEIGVWERDLNVYLLIPKSLTSLLDAICNYKDVSISRYLNEYRKSKILKKLD